ncbi:hypothetical protein PAL_GLEAN10010095 [Pteropus alecto]|uniref:Uncharacterized protein n=1 Tax=Pteropus alecto TaxID=9402 RepID=L5JYZ4_PTEAL|nr:hypothetical protein PAL_GLEAN10010095 [Pteropus alecto]
MHPVPVDPYPFHTPRAQRKASFQTRKMKEGSSRLAPPEAPLLIFYPPPSRCLWDNEEPSLPPSLGSSLQPPSPAGLSSFPCDPRLGTHPLWFETEWPWIQEEAMSSSNLEGCVCWGHMVGQTPSPGFGLQGPWGPVRRHPPLGMWREPGLSPPYVILGKSLPSPDRGASGLAFPMQLAQQSTVCNFEDPTAPGLHKEVARASGWHFRL